MTHAKDLLAVAVLMVAAGLAITLSSLTHHFSDLPLMQRSIPVTSTVVYGLLYVIAGLFLVINRTWASRTSLACIGLNLVGTIAIYAGIYREVSVPEFTWLVVEAAVVITLCQYVWWRTEDLL